MCLGVACADAGPKRRRASPTHDAQCREPARSKAFFYPSADGKTFAPDDPHADGCALLVPDYLFCCPEARGASAR
jgi:hypothetical protein